MPDLPSSTPPSPAPGSPSPRSRKGNGKRAILRARVPQATKDDVTLLAGARGEEAESVILREALALYMAQAHVRTALTEARKLAAERKAGGPESEK